MILRLLVHSNVFVSISVLILTWGTAENFEIYFSIYEKVFIASCTLLVYNMHRFIGGMMTEETSMKPFVVKSFQEAALRSSVPVLAIIYCIIFLSQTQLILLIPAGIISMLYVGDLFFRQTDTGLRSIPFVKIFLIAMVWSIVTVLFPLAEGLGYSSRILWIMFVERFFFILAITVPFDIRDLGIDNKGLRTIPQILGIKRAKLLSIVFLIIAGFLTIILYSSSVYSINLFYPIVLFYVTTTILLMGSDKGKSDYYYSFWIEGTMLLWGAFLLFF